MNVNPTALCKILTTERIKPTLLIIEKFNTMTLGTLKIHKRLQP